MKYNNKKRNNKNKNNDEDDDIDVDDTSNTKLWYTEISDDPADFTLASEDVIASCKEEARKCLESEVTSYNIKNSKTNSDFRWMKTVTAKGTASDKVAACTVLIQDSPITNLDTLRNLVSTVKVGKKNECLLVIDTLTELFLTSLLKPDQKLKSFYQRPLLLLSELSSGNAVTRRKYLTYWYFEDQIKEIYLSFVLALNKTGQDTIDVNKERAIGAMYKLLAGHPEQEKNLLIFIVNKLGDPSQKVASKAIYCLNQLLFKHVNMQEVVLGEVEKLLFRPNVGQKAQYYGICFLTQFYLSHDSTNVAKKLIELYFSFFKACIKLGEVDSRMMSALLMGVNRAYPYAKLELEKISDHIDTMYRIVHIANFNVSLHALMLLHQVSEYSNNVNDRFYSALYKKLHDPKLLSTTHQAMFLNLMYKALMKDMEVSRTKAFIKRLLQLALLMQPPFACSILYLVSQLFSKKSNIQANEIHQVQKLEKFDDDDEEERYVDVIDSNTAIIKIEDEDVDEDNKEVVNLALEQSVSTNAEAEGDEKPDVEVLNESLQQGSSWVHSTTIIKKEKKDPTTYDPLTRNPLYAGAEYSAYVELLSLKDHYHPTVSLYAGKLLEGTPITYSGDPLKDFSLKRFLDRFVFKNPKKVTSTNGSHPTFGKRKKYKPVGLRLLSVKSEKYVQAKEEHVPIEELYLYKYMQRKSNKKPWKEDEESDLESVGSEEFEDMLDKMTGHKEIDDDINYMDEIGNNLKGKSKKGPKNVQGSDESDAGSGEGTDEEFDANDDFGDENSDHSIDELLNEDENEDGELSDMEFGSDADDDNVAKIKKKMKKKNINSVFASAEEFASILEDEGSNSKSAGKSNAFSNQDNAAVKQLAWEEKRNHWLQGYNTALGKKTGKFRQQDKYNKKRPMKNKFNKNKKQKIS